MTDAELERLAQTFDHPSAAAVVLVGSHARGEAGPHSDVDLVRFVDAELPGQGSHLFGDRLVNVSDALPEEVEAWFTRPERAVDVVLGLREARVLVSRGDRFAQVQARAAAFAWNRAMQERADAWASAQLVGWAEEALKGLEGLRRDDPGRLLLARFGLSWGLARTVRVQRGLVGGSENDFFRDLEGAFAGSRWWELVRCAFGVTGLDLREQVRAGLELYALTAELLEGSVQPGDRPVVEHAVRHIVQAGLDLEGRG